MTKAEKKIIFDKCLHYEKCAEETTKNLDMKREFEASALSIWVLIGDLGLMGEYDKYEAIKKAVNNG